MKTTNIFISALTLVILLACSGGKEELPDNIEELKALQKEKKEEISRLDKELKEVQKKMEEVEPGIFEPDPKLITTAQVPRGEFKRYISIQGSVMSDEDVYISSEAAGRLVDLRIEEGDRVRKGQLVGRVDLESLRKQKEEVEKNLELAMDVYERQKRLWDKNIGSEIEYLRAKNRVEGLEKSIASIDHQLTKSNIYAPITGEVANLLKEQGEVLAPGEPIAELLDNSVVKVAAEIPERYLTAVRKGDEVIINIPAIDLEKPMVVTRVGSMIDPQNRTFTVEVTMPNPDGILKPNLVANMKINDLSREDVITVPSYLVQQEVSGQFYVFVMDEKDGKTVASKRRVTIGESYEGMIVIEDGLTVDDVLIDQGARNIAEGEYVKTIQKPVDTTGLTSKK